MGEQFVSTHDMGDGKYRENKLLQGWVVVVLVIDCEMILNLIIKKIQWRSSFVRIRTQFFCDNLRSSSHSKL